MDTDVSFSPEEIGELEDACQMAMSVGAALKTYAIKKLLYSFIKHLPRDSPVRITNKLLDDKSPDLYVYIETKE